MYENFTYNQFMKFFLKITLLLIVNLLIILSVTGIDSGSIIIDFLRPVFDVVFGSMSFVFMGFTVFGSIKYLGSKNFQIASFASFALLFTFSFAALFNTGFIGSTVNELLANLLGAFITFTLLLFMAVFSLLKLELIDLRRDWDRLVRYVKRLFQTDYGYSRPRRDIKPKVQPKEEKVAPKPSPSPAPKPIVEEEEPPTEISEKLFSEKVDYHYQKPSLEHLDDLESKNSAAEPIDHDAVIEKIQSILKVKVSDYIKAPQVSTYFLDTADKPLQDDIYELSSALGLGNESIANLGLAAGRPNTNKIAITHTNAQRRWVSLRECLEDQKERQNGTSKLEFCIGVNYEGSKVFANLDEFKHMLVAGITHSGKSVALNSIISSFVFTHSPQTLRLMLFTPKNDFDKYKKLPHLPDRYDVIKENAILALEEVDQENERRKAIFDLKNCVDIDDHNKKHPDAVLPYIVVIIDEYSEFARSEKGFEGIMDSLVRKTRSSGIFFILAVQDVAARSIAAEVSGNLAGRWGFKINSTAQQKLMFQQGDVGTDDLLLYGDGYFEGGSSIPEPVRTQAPFNNHDDIAKFIHSISFIKN